MTEKEFRKKAREYGYSLKQIREFIELVESACTDGVHMRYGDIVLVE